jgi:hypothetical protein
MLKIVFFGLIIGTSVLMAGCSPLQKTTIELKDAQVKLDDQDQAEPIGTATDPDALEKEVDSYQIEEEAL